MLRRPSCSENFGFPYTNPLCRYSCWRIVRTRIPVLPWVWIVLANYPYPGLHRDALFFFEARGHSQLENHPQIRGKTQIEGLLTYPADHEKGKRYPLLLNVHGGPAGIFKQSYVATPGQYPIAAFSGRGYAVLRPN